MITRLDAEFAPVRERGAQHRHDGLRGEPWPPRPDRRRHRNP
jgi:hypothetical protein